MSFLSAYPRSVRGGFLLLLVFFKQKTAYDMRISDWSSDVCASDLFDPKGSQCGRYGPRRGMTRNIKMSWTDERIEQLRNMWEKGLTASQIADELGGVSRNADRKSTRLNSSP